MWHTITRLQRGGSLGSRFRDLAVLTWSGWAFGRPCYGFDYFLAVFLSFQVDTWNFGSAKEPPLALCYFELSIDA